jgi:acyl-[acyl carrier protein]--UDP-N-acetylglucosamine O-acyltransferase
MSEDIYNPNARFDESNKIHDTAIIYDNVVMGKNNVIGPFTVIGSDGEIRGVKNFMGRVVIGDNNTISEHVTIQRPASETETKIGDNNLIMAHAHIGHDVEIGNDCEICTGTIIGGYTKINDGSRLKLGVTVRNRMIIGKKCTVGLGSAVVKNVPDNAVVVGVPAKPLDKK